MMGSTGKSVMWFRRDLRVEDNPALAAAARESSAVLPVFIWCPGEEGQFFPGRVSRWWLKQSLTHLAQSLDSLGCPLVVIKAETSLAALVQCIRAVGATRVLFNHLYDPISLTRDHNVKAQLSSIGVTVQSYNADLLFEPWEVYDDDGHAFTTFDPFWDKCMTLQSELSPILPPWKVPPASGVERIQSCSIEELGLEFEQEKSSNSLLSRAWSPGWRHADKMLAEFVNRHLDDYAANRMKLDGATTSTLSPYLHFGEISVRKVYQTIRVKQLHLPKEQRAEGEESIRLFLRSIGLREYSRYLCFHFPFTHERSLMGNLKHYPWHADEGNFKCWRQGKTGYPLVDAGMRELWATGWLHNRTRVIVASFSVKILHLPWTWGMKYFWDTLLDADLECDILGWQYISGSLPDGHPLNRLDVPEIQGENFDPDGEYVRSWIPELARMPAQWIHHPWDAPNSVLRSAGVELGVNYPKPIVDINTAQEWLDDAISMMWQLNRAEKAAKLGGLEEVVADNSVELSKFDIPMVIVRKELSCTTSASDQRVPSIHKVAENLVTRKPPDLNKRDGIDDFSEKMTSSRMEDDDLCSTAVSSSSKKRSMSSSSLRAVPNQSFSASEETSSKEGDPHLPVEDKDGVQDQDDADVFRPSKRPA